MAATEYSRLLRNVISRRVPPHDVEDVLQAVLVKLLLSMNEEFNDENLVARLRQIAKCQIAEYWARQARDSKYLDWTGDVAELVENGMVANDESCVTSDLEDQALLAQRCRRVKEAIEALSATLSAPLWLFFEGHSYREIAERLGTTEHAVKTNISRARQALIQWFKEKGL